MPFLSSQQQSILDQYILDNKLDEAIDYINGLLQSDPTNEELLFIVADIQYRKWEINKATKAIDFINSKNDNNDPMGLYVKWVLEMEKNNWKEARAYLLQAMERLDKDNAEVLRCYGLAEYWYGNREKWLYQLERARDLQQYDAEIIYNLIQTYLLEKNYRKAQDLIQFFYDHQEDLELYDKPLEFYKEKIDTFVQYIATYQHKKVNDSE